MYLIGGVRSGDDNFANEHQSPENIYLIGDKVMLSSLHRRQELMLLLPHIPSSYQTHLTSFQPFTPPNSNALLPMTLTPSCTENCHNPDPFSLQMVKKNTSWTKSSTHIVEVVIGNSLSTGLVMALNVTGGFPLFCPSRV